MRTAIAVLAESPYVRPCSSFEVHCCNALNYWLIYINHWLIKIFYMHCRRQVNTQIKVCKQIRSKGSIVLRASWCGLVWLSSSSSLQVASSTFICHLPLFAFILRFIGHRCERWHTHTHTHGHMATNRVVSPLLGFWSSISSLRAMSVCLLLLAVIYGIQLELYTFFY